MRYQVWVGDLGSWRVLLAVPCWLEGLYLLFPYNNRFIYCKRLFIGISPIVVLPNLLVL